MIVSFLTVPEAYCDLAKRVGFDLCQSCKNDHIAFLDGILMYSMFTPVFMTVFTTDPKISPEITLNIVGRFCVSRRNYKRLEKMAGLFACLLL